MGTHLQDLFLQQSVAGLGAYTLGAFRVGVSLCTGREDRCVCSLSLEGSHEKDACRSFSAGLFDAAASRQRCPAGLFVVARPFTLSPPDRLLLATHGFLETGEPMPPGLAAPSRRRPPLEIPRLDGPQIHLLENVLGMGVELVTALARTAGETALEELREETWRDLLGAPTIVGVTPAVAALREALPTLANSREPLFLDGEPGTGRLLVATTIHRLGPRHAQPFIAENLAALPAELQEKELFGGERTPGLLGQAGGGTFYLAAVDQLTAPAQERLSALLAGESHERPAKRSPRADARIISSAGADLDALARRGRFRKELAERLRTLQLPLPPLRERPDDLPLLVEHLLHRRAARLRSSPATVAPEALEALKKHSWAGNVRELDAELERAAAGRSLIRLEDLSAPLARSARARKSAGTDLRQVVAEVEVELIGRTLAGTNWNKSRAARLLGLSRLGLQKKIDRFGIDRRR